MIIAKVRCATLETTCAQSRFSSAPRRHTNRRSQSASTVPSDVHAAQAAGHAQQDALATSRSPRNLERELLDLLLEPAGKPRPQAATQLVEQLCTLQQPVKARGSPHVSMLTMSVDKLYWKCC